MSSVLQKNATIALSMFCAANAFAADAPELSFQIDPAWAAKVVCSEIRSVPSPRITIGNLPASTSSLSLQMTDLTYKHYDHGKGEVSATDLADQTLSEGAFEVTRPCPKKGKVHEYEFELKAFDASENEIAAGIQILPILSTRK